ncbi:MAG: lysine transporter LysE [Chitinophagaceae bacterium]|nr:lysine transporter LysE [Chitinophagaceae bacterium]
MLILVRVLFTGLLVSFIGSLPLGTLNVAAMQISITDGVKAAIQFSIGSLLAEIIYVRLSLVAMDWIRRQVRLLLFFDWMTLVLLLALAGSSFYAATHPASHAGNPILSSTLPKILLGFLMSAINPVQIPFWFGWSSVLLAKGFIEPKHSHYNAYIIGIGIGTFLGNSVFIFGGQLVASAISNNQSIVSGVIGVVFLVSAGWQLFRLLQKKDAVHRMNNPKEEKNKAGEKLDKWESHWLKKPHQD